MRYYHYNKNYNQIHFTNANINLTVHQFDIVNCIFMFKLSFIFFCDKATLIFRPVIPYTKKNERKRKKKKEYFYITTRATNWEHKKKQFFIFCEICLIEITYIYYHFGGWQCRRWWSRVCFIPHTHAPQDVNPIEETFSPEHFAFFCPPGELFLLDLIIPSSTLHYCNKI